MTPQHYQRRKATGRCIRCRQAAALPHVLCADHLARAKAYDTARREAARTPEQRSMRQNRARLAPTPVASGLPLPLPTAPRPLLYHCKTWHPITVPFVCPVCATTLLQEEKPDAPALCE